jgi:2-polyprenyl-6-methoxyphenol hydroxylase-like FAD-dependent oxidoreductase
MLMKHIRNLNLGISGGSIAGCSLAILLKRAGINVTVFERSTRPLVGRGAGIAMPGALLQSCIQQNLFDTDIPHREITKRSFSTKNKKIWEQDFNIVTLNWGHIYQNLRKRIPDNVIQQGTAVVSAEHTDNRCLIETTQSDKQPFDYFIAADGVHSSLRKLFFPTHSPEYAGYVAWRGTTEASELINHAEYYFYPQGHLLLYPIPSAETGKTLINWLIYEVCEPASLSKLMVDKNDVQHSVSLPSDSLTQQHQQHLHQMVEKNFPDEIAKMITQTKQPFLQAIFDLQIPDFVFKKTCFIGDAATVLRPHTASGVTKAIHDSISLAKTFEQNHLLQSLSDWNDSQKKNREQQSALSKAMGEGLVTHQPEWDKMNSESIESWWSQLMSGKHWYATTKRHT